ncbi:15948_t:CDS:1, partial [Funneliformis mosseae]
MMQNWQLDSLLFNQLNNSKLAEGLKLLQSRSTTGSLAAKEL